MLLVYLHVHAVMIEMNHCGFIVTLFAKYNKIWELSFLNSPKFHHRQYSKLVYSPMFSSPKSRIYRFAKVLPRQGFALYGICQEFVRFKLQVASQTITSIKCLANAKSLKVLRFRQEVLAKLLLLGFLLLLLFL